MNISIIGTGNVGTHLNKAFSETDNVSLINSRTLSGLSENTDICLLCVSDTAISEVAKKAADLVDDDCIMAHTSGSIPMDALQGIKRNIGVFYPLQTFSKGVKLDYSTIPIFIEANNQHTENILYSLAGHISSHITIADSQKRKSIHLASVLSCNFVNHLWSLADNYLRSNDLDFEILRPLIAETLRKASVNSPSEVQTGPASRRDMVTINSHLEMLKDNPELRNIYEMLSTSIMNNGRNKLQS